MKTILLTLLLATACGKKAQVNEKKLPETAAPQTLQLTQQEHLRNAVEANDARNTDALLRAGSDAELLFSDGSSLLTFAIAHNFTAVVEALLQNGASPNKPDKNGNLPLFLALDQNSPDLTKLLVQSGALLNGRDAYGRTPLMLAVMQEDAALAQWLVERGAQIDLRDSQNRDAIQYATELGMPELANLMRVRLRLQTGSATSDLLAGLIAVADVEGMTLLLKEKSSLLQAPVAPSPMHLAIQHAHEQRSRAMVAMLLNFGASVERNGNDGASPMALAAGLGRVDLIKLFLAHGGDSEAIDDQGLSVLAHAIQQVRPEAVATLVALEVPRDYKFNNRTVKACDLARATRRSLTAPEQLERMEQIMQRLGCGLRWLLSW